jgi:hypothetical protein
MTGFRERSARARYIICRVLSEATKFAGIMSTGSCSALSPRDQGGGVLRKPLLRRAVRAPVAHYERH